MTTYPARHLSLSIECPYTKAYAYLADPVNMPAWAHGLGQGFHQLGHGNWHAETPAGPATVAFTNPNPYGILDHTLHTDSPHGSSTYNPMRLIINGSGVEIIFTLFQHTGTTDKAFVADAGTVLQDLTRLKHILEKTSENEQRQQA